MLVSTSILIWYNTPMQEIFKPVPYIPFNERYSISNMGRLRVDQISKYSNNKTQFLRPGFGAKGYPVVTLYYNGKGKQFQLHRMVLTAFRGSSPTDKNHGMHLDDNKTNNRLDNLSWGSQNENMALMVLHGRSNRNENVNTAKLTKDQVKEIRLKYKEGATQVTLASLYCVRQTTISKIVRRQYWKNVF